MMTKWVFFSLYMIILYFPCASHAEDSANDWLQKMELQNRESQLQIEKSTLELQRMETERLKNQAEFERNQAELDRFSAETERQRSESEKEPSLSDMLEDARKEREQEEAKKNSQDAVDEIQNQLLQSEVRHKNQLFLGVVILIVTIFLWSVAKRYRKEEFMKDYEKFGVVTILASSLLVLMVLMISEPWVERFDFIQNLMSSLRVRLFQEDCYECYFVNFPTKYAVLALISLATYGFTTYLGITPPFKKKKY